MIYEALFHVVLIAAGTDTVPGKLVVEHPTLHNLGFEWPISGDTNRNAVVKVDFRPFYRDNLAYCRDGLDFIENLGRCLYTALEFIAVDSR